MVATLLLRNRADDQRQVKKHVTHELEKLVSPERARVHVTIDLAVNDVRVRNETMLTRPLCLVADEVFAHHRRKVHTILIWGTATLGQ